MGNALCMVRTYDVSRDTFFSFDKLAYVYINVYEFFNSQKWQKHTDS